MVREENSQAWVQARALILTRTRSRETTAIRGMMNSTGEAR